jgi:tetratricopeptide (TPR) repeat protein
MKVFLLALLLCLSLLPSPSVCDSVDDIIGKAESLKANGDIKGAVVLYRQAVEKKPKVPAINFNLASLLVSSGQFLEAEPYYKRAFELDAKSPATSFYLAYCKLQVLFFFFLRLLF